MQALFVASLKKITLPPEAGDSAVAFLYFPLRNSLLQQAVFVAVYRQSSHAAQLHAGLGIFFGIELHKLHPIGGHISNERNIVLHHFTFTSHDSCDFTLRTNSPYVHMDAKKIAFRT